jgi:glycerophosphoryl diester phosphodiesterase
MRCFAHRGCAAQYPENTLRAFRETGPELGAIECDARRCGSGELVVIHDPDLDRVTDGEGPVADTPLDRLRELDVLDSGEGIPLLSEVFETLPASVTVNVELKESGIAADAYAVCEGFDHEVIVSSFEETALREAETAGFDSLAYLFFEDPAESVETAIDLGCAYVHPHWRLCVEGDLVEAAHEQDLEVNAWTLETPEEVERCRECGVDGVIVDREDAV